MKTHVEFTNGQKMPIVGLGMWQANDATELETAVDEAIKMGYRHFDTAYAYMNEDILGRVLKKWLDSGKIKREELFIVTKLPANAMHEDRVEDFMQKSLTALQLDYVDLYLVHSPFATKYISDKEVFPFEDAKIVVDNTTDLESVWKAMENQVDAGRAKAIGISNFNPKQIERIMKIARIHPENLQVEITVHFQQKELRALCKKHKITVCAYSPLGSPGRKAFYDKIGFKVEVPNLLEDPIVLEVAKKNNKSAGQILLRFLVQQGIAVIPKSVNPARLRENFETLDFELSDADMRLLHGLDKGDAGRSVTMSTFPGLSDHPECPF